MNLHGWDGEWYRRAYFDDGTPLGSPAIANAALILSLKVGLYYQGLQIHHVQNKQ